MITELPSISDDYATVYKITLQMVYKKEESVSFNFVLSPFHIDY